MRKIASLGDLTEFRSEIQSRLKLRDQSNEPESPVLIRVGMATCGIASGARETMNFMVEALEFEAIDAVVTQTGCLGFCYAEPTVEVKIAGKEPVIFGYVDKTKAREIIERYIIKGEAVEGVIPLPFVPIDL